jgi:two-component system sensor histidine kinase CpxA
MASGSLFVKIVASAVALVVFVAIASNAATWLLGIPADDPQNVALYVRIAAAFIVVLAVCWWLARNITQPVTRIGEASQQIATGDLGTRVSDAVGPRRDELGRLGRDFDAMAARIEALVTAQHRLLRDVSHELRSPLARLSIAVELARRDAPSTTQAQLDRIEREAERLNGLIGQLLALGRLDAGIDASQQTVFDLSAVIDEVAADCDFEARAAGRCVRIVASERCLATGARDLMRSAVENVVRNAIRFTPGGADVDIALRVSWNGGGGRADIRVRDYGAGVPEAVLPRLFEPFYRVPGTVPGTGSGLGLAITARAVELHGGSIRAMNAADGGLAITISLPLGRSDRGTATPRPSAKT